MVWKSYYPQAALLFFFASSAFSAAVPFPEDVNTSLDEDTTTTTTTTTTSADPFSLRGTLRRKLAASKIADESYPLYENDFWISVTTPWKKDQQCLDENYVYDGGNPVNFTWYGLRLLLPEDAANQWSFSFSNVASSVKEIGYQQAYGEETPVVVYNSTFQTTEKNPTIKINFNDQILFSPYQFIFDDNNGDPVEATSGIGAVTCLVERFEDGDNDVDVWSVVGDAVLTMSMTQTQIREGTRKSSASLMSSLPLFQWYLSPIITVVAFVVFW
jgi:hypothetical protein